MTFRATSRVLLIDPGERVLMFLQYGKDCSVPPRWITPGGGADPGEDHVQAAIRELREETGLVLDAVPARFRDEDFSPDQRWHRTRSATGRGTPCVSRISSRIARDGQTRKSRTSSNGAGSRPMNSTPSTPPISTIMSD